MANIITMLRELTITVTVSETGNETSKEFTVKVVEPAKLIVEDKY
ncbi:MAG: hypothetical protein ACLRQF_08620 [Thomasclavelia ramosa]